MNIFTRYSFIVIFFTLTAIKPYAATTENKDSPTVIAAHNAEKKEIWRQPISWDPKEVALVNDMASLNGAAYKAEDCPKNVVLTRIGIILRTASNNFTYRDFLIPFIFVSGTDLSAYPSLIAKKVDKSSADAWKAFNESAMRNAYAVENKLVATL